MLMNCGGPGSNKVQTTDRAGWRIMKESVSAASGTGVARVSYHKSDGPEECGAECKGVGMWKI